MLLPFHEFSLSQSVQERAFWTYTTPRLISIESNNFQQHSIKPWLTELSKVVKYPFELDHLTVKNGDDFIQNLKFRKDYEAAPFYYISIHGEPGSVVFTKNSGFGLDDLVYPLQNGQESDRIVYFSACSVLQGEDGKILADHLLKDGGFKAVIGYNKDLNVFDAIFTDLLFIHTFFSNEDPIDVIEKIYLEVLGQYSPAKELGLKIFSKKKLNINPVNIYNRYGSSKIYQ